MKYYFILGKNPKLSKEEIESVLELKKVKYKIELFLANILILDIKKSLKIDWLNERLGGTVKIGQILGKVNHLQEIQDKFFNWIKLGENKVFFGFSLYSINKQNNLKKLQKKLQPVAMEIKRKLREEKNINSRWVSSKEAQLSAVIVKKNKLLKYGADICLLVNQNKILVGQTLAVQLFEEFGARDYARPGRDDVSGMLPPKLAKIMINLAQAKEKELILDPFCGSGTILQEAILMNYENIIGFDKSEKAIQDTQTNINWLQKKYDSISLKNFQIEQADVKDLDKKLEPKSIDHIITEPYLGPPLKGNETELQLNQNISELEKLYLQAFEQFKKVLKPKGKVVIVIPEFKFKNEIKKLKLDKINGFKVLNKERLEYSRPGQLVIRNIMIYQKS